MVSKPSNIYKRQLTNFCALFFPDFWPLTPLKHFHLCSKEFNIVIEYGLCNRVRLRSEKKNAHSTKGEVLNTDQP